MTETTQQKTEQAPEQQGEDPESEFPVHDQDSSDCPVEEFRPTDPALVAAGRLLEQALAREGGDFAVAGRDGVIVVIVVLPDVSWTELAEKSWRNQARSGQNSSTDRYWSRSTSASAWRSWAPTEEPRSSQRRDEAEQFAKAVAAGQHCVGFASAPEWLPEDLVLGADYRLKLSPLRGEDIGAIARDICGDGPTSGFDDERAALLTPRLLRLACRRGQSADEYLAKLAALLSRDLASQATRSPPSTASTVRDRPGLERLHGMAEAVEWGLNLARDIKLFREGRIPWADVDRGVLLSGPPGCGKTLFARALSATCDVPLVTGSYSDWHGSGYAHQGDLLKAMKRSFTAARESAPAILFIDEVDSFPDRSKITHRWADWEIQVVNALLAEVDGVEGRDGVVLVAACNHPEKLDPALVRSGRLDRHIRIGLPNPTARAKIMREHLGPELPCYDLYPAAVLAAGATGADVERLVRGARARARRAARDLSPDDLVSEISGSVSPAELRLVAVHEAGHAVACCVLHVGSLSAVSTRSRAGRKGGLTIAAASGAFLSAGDIHLRLVMCLAGRAAEELLFGQPTSGAGGGPDSDLAEATLIATTAASALGLDTTVGLIWLGLPDHATLPKVLRNSPGLVARVRQVVGAAYQEALALLGENRLALEAVAAALEKNRALAGTDIAAIVDRHRTRRGKTAE